MTEQNAPDQRPAQNSAQNSARRRRSRLRRWGVGGLALVLVAVLGAAALAYSLLGQRVTAPDWVDTRVRAALNAQMGEMTLDFADLSVVMSDDLVPSVRMQGVRVRDEAGVPLVQLSDIEGALSLRALLVGEIKPATLRLSGARLILRRAADGTMQASFGDTGGTTGADSTVETAPDTAALLDRIDAVFARPAFANLDRVEADALTVQFEDARAGRIWTADGGRVTLDRDGDALELRADVALLGGRDYATALAMRYRSVIGETAAELGFEFEDMPSRDIAGQSPALSWLDALDAPISGRIDVGVAEDADGQGTLGPLDVVLDIGEGTLRPTEGAAPVAFSHAEAAFTYSPEGQMIRFSRIGVDSAWVTARGVGQTFLTGMEDGWPDALVAQIRLEEITANPFALYPEPVGFDGANLDMRLTMDPFHLAIGEFTVSDQQVQMVARGDVRADPEGWRVALDAHVPEATSERLLELWPMTLEPKTRTWITDNVETAKLGNIQLALRLEPERKPDVYLGFDFHDLTSRFIKDVAPIENGRGHASIFDNRFAITAQAGYVQPPQGGRIDITGSSFEIPDLRINRGPGRVYLTARSTITAGLSLLDSGPFGFMQKIGRPVTLADGRAAVSGQLDFLVKDDLTTEEVAFQVDGVLSDVSSAKLVENRVIAASELRISANADGMQVRGPGRVGRVPFEGNFTMPFTRGTTGEARVEGWVELSERFMDEFEVGLPPGSVTGQGRGDIEIDFAPDTPPRFAMQTDLAGLALRLDALDWRVGRDQTGRLEVEGSLGPVPQLDRVALNAAGLRAQGSVTLNPNGQLQQANFTRVQLGTWLDAPVDLVGLGPDKPPLVRVTGGELDLREVSLAGNPDSPRAPSERGPVSLRLDRLQISDALALTDFNGEFDMSKGPNGRFSGRLNGQSEIAGRIVPEGGRSSFEITAQDAGGVLRSANFLRGARDGSLRLWLRPGEGQGTYEGLLKIEALRVKEAPALAALINAVSVVGLLEQLNGQGLHFGEVEARFQLKPDRVTLYSGSAVGAALGISMEGYYYPENGYLDMEGVFSPVYALNALGSMFTRRGEGLFGVVYDLKGSKDNPQVIVNPLSVFTPGGLREIFRSPSPSYDPGRPVEQDSNRPELLQDEQRGQ